MTAAVSFADPEPARLRDVSGDVLAAPADRWFRPAGSAEVRALASVRGPALDIGCGPGRHVLALAEQGVPALGIDITTRAVAHARAAGAAVLERCVFDRVPGAGRWRSALLLDGNLGIGGDPVTLLRRTRELLAHDGRVLTEVAPPGTDSGWSRVRFEIGATNGPWFAWTVVGADELEPIAHAADLAPTAQWCDDDRWFAWLAT